jgi:phage shock protein A
MSDIKPGESIAEALEDANPVFVSHASSLEELAQRVEQIAQDSRAQIEQNEQQIQRAEQIAQDSRAQIEETRARIKQIEQQIQEMLQIISSSQGPTT